MSTTKHTPGPWIMEYNGDCAPQIKAGIHTIADALFFVPVTEEATVLANARLIAAAPDLLAAAEGAKELLKELHAVSGGSFDPHSSQRYCALEAAITKAKGEK